MCMRFPRRGEQVMSSSSIANQLATRHPVLPDIGKKEMAKADVRSADIDWNRLIAQAIRRAVLMAFESHKEAIAAIEEATGSPLDDAEFGKWLNGSRRPQLDKLLAVEALRDPIVVQIGKLVGYEPVTTLRKVG